VELIVSKMIVFASPAHLANPKRPVRERPEWAEGRASTPYPKPFRKSRGYGKDLA
jgi:hypothetical protein